MVDQIEPFHTSPLRRSVRVQAHALEKSAHLLILLGLWGHCAYADDYKIYSPHVEEGEFSLEANLNYSVDDPKNRGNSFSQVDGVEYGVTDFWRTELTAELEKGSGASNKLTR